MKFILSFKTPDCIDLSDLPHEDQEAFIALGDKFVKYGKYIKVEFDTELGTCSVLPVEQR